MTHENELHEDLSPTIEQLRAARPELAPDDLDAVKRRVRARVGRRPATPLRSRIAITATLATGLVLSTGGASLAISGFASQDDGAARIQYGQAGTGGEVLGEDESGRPSSGEGGGGNPDRTQRTRQVEQGSQGGGEELPFTGFAAIPILLGGVALTGGGLALRRSAKRE